MPIENVELPRYSSIKINVECDICCKKWQMTYRRAKDNLDRHKGLINCISCAHINNEMYIKNRKYNFQQDFMSEINSEEKAYLLGWIASDGWLEQNRFAILVHKKDVEILIKLKNIICESIPITFKNKDHVQWRVNSLEMVRDICKWLKIQPKSKFDIVSPPDLSEDLFRHFVRGFFDGDGHVVRESAKSFHCCIRTSSLNMLLGISNLLGGRVYKDSIYWYGQNGIDFMNKIYQKSEIKLDRKYKRYLYWKEFYL